MSVPPDFRLLVVIAVVDERSSLDFPGAHWRMVTVMKQSEAVSCAAGYRLTLFFLHVFHAGEIGCSVAITKSTWRVSPELLVQRTLYYF